MSLTAHNNFFGFLNSFKIDHNNGYIGATEMATIERPYPIIATNPSYPQVMKNWNRADTGCVISFFLIGLLISKRLVKMNRAEEAVTVGRSQYRGFTRIFLVLGLYFGAQNSAYRLEGLTPNGLPRKEVDEVVKYDYTTEFLRSTFWRFIFEEQQKPTNL